MSGQPEHQADGGGPERVPRRAAWRRPLAIAAWVPAVAVLLLILVVVWINLAYPNDTGAGYLLLFALAALAPVVAANVLVFGAWGLIARVRESRQPDAPGEDGGDGLAGALPEAAPAGFRRRAAALLVDLAVLSTGWAALGGLLTLALGWVDRGGSDGVEEQLLLALGFPVWIGMPWLYYTVFEASRRQATPGKALLGLRVTDLQGGRLGFGRANARFWAKSLSLLSLLVGFLMSAVTPRRQALHDLLARCIVVRRSN